MDEGKKIDLDNWIDKKVTLRGIAGNAHQGAVLIVNEDQPVYVDGVEAWESLKVMKVASGDEILVMGKLLRKVESSNLKADDGVMSHGLEGASYHMRGATFHKVSEGNSAGEGNGLAENS